jgi:hypothetical protein
MNKMKYVLAIMVAGSLGFSTATLAQGQGHGNGWGHAKGSQRFENRVDRRQDRQWARISDAREYGDLSHREVRGLRKDQHKLAHMERRFERDGYYSPRERRVMDRAMDRASDRIHRAKHNDHGRGYGRHHRASHGGHHGHGHGYGPTTYVVSDESYIAGASTSNTLSAQLDGFTVSWSTLDQQ